MIELFLVYGMEETREFAYEIRRYVVIFGLANGTLSSSFIIAKSILCWNDLIFLRKSSKLCAICHLSLFFYFKKIPVETDSHDFADSDVILANLPNLQTKKK